MPSPSATSSSSVVLEIETLDTALFPEGGGQPSDQGSVRLLSRNGAGSAQEGSQGKVLHVLRRGLRAIHYVQAENREAFAVGDEVLWEVDWTRRMDLMTTHTSQHVLSALLDALPTPLPVRLPSLST